MSNPLSSKQPNINELYQQFTQNPMKYLTGLNLPQGINNPQQIVKYLNDNGKIPPMLQGRVNAMLGK